MQDEINELVEMVIGQVIQDEHVTDHVFCAIEKDPNTMKLYQDLCRECGNSGKVNQDIGRAVREYLGWKKGNRSRASSSLTGTYTRLIPPQK